MWGHETTRTLLLAAALCGTAGGTAAMAQTQQAAGERSFAIPAGKLAEALVQFGYQSGLQIAADGQLTAKATTPGLAGRYAPAEALNRLLSGTGLTYRFTTTGAVQLERSPQASGDAIQLGPVQVEGRSETAADQQNPAGPNSGYVATRALAGTKTATALLDTPQAISVVTRQQMDDQNVQSVPEALRYSSGVLAESRGVSESGLEYIYGRGFLIDTFLDGLRLPSGNTGSTGYNIVSVDPYFLQSIQVLHGPASVLYGQASPGGVVDLVSKQPTADPMHEIVLQTGSYNRAQASVDLGGPLDSSGTFLYRLTALAYDTDTQVNHVENQRIAIAPSIAWRPDADTTVTVLASYQDDPKAGFYNFLPAQGTVLPNAAGKVPLDFDPGDPTFDEHKRTQASVGYSVEHHVDDTFTARQNFRYLNIDDQYRNLFGFGVSAANPAILNRYAFVNDENLGYLTVDNQLQADFGTGPLQHTFLVGVDYAHTTGREAYGLGAAPSIDIFAPVYGQNVAIPAYSGIEHFSQDRIGLYAQEQLTYDRLHILLGGRQDWYDASDVEQYSGTLETQHDTPATWRAGLVYEFGFGLAPYASYATSFQPDESSSYTGALLAPTTAQQYEVGVKYQPPSATSFVTLSAFNLTEQNVATPDPVHVNFDIATGEIRSRGIELEGHASLTEGVDLVASYTYTDAIVTRSTSTNLDKAPTGIPRNMASLWGTYRFSAPPLAGLQLGAGVRYVGSSYGTTTNDFEVPSYTLVDAAVQYDLGSLASSLSHWQASINATNLFDKHYVASCIAAANCNYGLGRMVLGKLAYRW